MRHLWISSVRNEEKNARSRDVMKAAGSQRGASSPMAHREREVRISQSHIGRAPSTTEHVRDLGGCADRLTAFFAHLKCLIESSDMFKQLPARTRCDTGRVVVNPLHFDCHFVLKSGF
jgi:hypothetical protein